MTHRGKCTHSGTQRWSASCARRQVYGEKPQSEAKPQQGRAEGMLQQQVAGGAAPRVCLPAWPAVSRNGAINHVHAMNPNPLDRSGSSRSIAIVHSSSSPNSLNASRSDASRVEKFSPPT